MFPLGYSIIAGDLLRASAAARTVHHDLRAANCDAMAKNTH